MPELSRRAVVVGGLALAAYDADVLGARATTDAVAAAPLKQVCPAPVGCAFATADLADTALMTLMLRNVSQVTPGWEMKMNPVVAADGRFRFAAPDLLVDGAERLGLPVHGHTLVWHKHEPAAFVGLASDRVAFAELYRRYITTIVARYRGRVRGWDVINEPIVHRGMALRDCVWGRVLGAEDYMVRAFEHAAEAAPDTPRFINEYGLEEPGKRGAFVRLVERLLARGAQIDGIGTQTHINIDLAEGAMGETMRDLARFGLPIHVSELDISFGHRRLDPRPVAMRRDLQARRAGEVARAFLALPPRQRYAFTLWGLRDRDSWLRMPPFPPGEDQPLPWDEAGAPKPMLAAMVDAFTGTSTGDAT